MKCALSMLRLLCALAAACALVIAPARAQPAPAGPRFVALTFHDVREEVRASFETDPDESAVDVRTLGSLFAWMRSNGWQAVSLQQVVAARSGGAPLPPKAVLLTFDDGLASAHSRVFPLLRQFGYPAVLSVVTSWLETPAGGSVRFGERELPRDRFLTWEQVRDMIDSGLVEIASHSHDLHRGIAGNPQGNVMPAAATHAWLPGPALHEDDAAWLLRVESDLRESVRILRQRTGRTPRAIAWPYGAWNVPLAAAAARAGLAVGLTLDEGANDASVPLDRLRRGYGTFDMDIAAYAALLEQQPLPVAQTLQRALHVDLDYVYDPDPAQQERNLSLLLDRVLAIGPRSVFLQAFADPDGDGVADALYFPNRHLPVRADLFSRVAWQLRTRSEVQVYAWMPVLAFRLPQEAAAADRVVQAADVPRPGDAARYHRLSPFDAQARHVIGEVYDDLGRHASFAGVLFHDDATLAADEDVSPAALAAFRAAGLGDSVQALRKDPAARLRWAEFKRRALTDFTLQLAQRLRQWHPALRTARNMYARPLLEPASSEWLAQDFQEFLAAYDYTAVMAMPYMEGADDADTWLARVAQRVLSTPGGRDRTVVELQARDWRSGRAVPDAVLVRHAQALKRLGIRHLAYYPDDFLAAQPSLQAARAVVSVREGLSGPLEGRPGRVGRRAMAPLRMLEAP